MFQFYNNHGHRLLLSIIGSTTSELPIVAVSFRSIECSGPGGVLARWRDGRKDEPRMTVVSLFRGRCHGIALPALQLLISTELLPGMPVSLAKGPHFLRVPRLSVCQVRTTSLRSLALIFFFCTSPYVLTSWVTCARRTPQVTDK